MFHNQDCSNYTSGIAPTLWSHIKDVATISAKTHLPTHLNRKLAIIISISVGFLMMHIQNVCGKAILIPILVEVTYMMALSALGPP